MKENQNPTLVKADNDYLYISVPSHSRDGDHCVKLNIKTGEWSCTCEHYFYRKAYCKHIKQANDYLVHFAVKSLDKKVYTGQLEKETIPTVVDMG